MIASLLPTYARAPLAFERGEGAYLYTDDGERYLDFASGIAVTALGHAHPHLVATLIEQAQKLWHVSNLFEISQAKALAERLIEHSFADTVFFTNSGAEALECAVKMTRRFFHVAGTPGRHRIITFENAFHGRTLATIAAGGQAKYLDGFEPRLDGFDQVPFADLDAVRRAITPATAGILIEPIQGEGGVRVATPEFLRALRDLADQAGLLLILDEVQCGMGRTGKLFAYEWAGIKPDVMAVAKGLGSGFPIGACLASERAASGMTLGTHGSTFGGNPLATAVGGAVLDILLEPGFFARVEAQAERLRQGLSGLVRKYPTVFEEVRGFGLLLGLKCRPPNLEVVKALRTNRMLAAGAGDNVLRLLPPLIIGAAEVDEALARLDTTARDFAALAA